MSSSVLLAASGVGAPIEAGVFVAGAVLWGAGTITKCGSTVKRFGSICKELLYEKIWGLESAADVSTVTVHIRKILGKIERDPA